MVINLTKIIGLCSLIIGILLIGSSIFEFLSKDDKSEISIPIFSFFIGVFFIITSMAFYYLGITW